MTSRQSSGVVYAAAAAMLAVSAGCAGAAAGTGAPIPRQMPAVEATAAAATDEALTAAYLESVRDDPPLLAIFLRQMPKGGDLHSHLSGAVYAESLIEWAAADGLCVDTIALAVSLPPTPADRADSEGSGSPEGVEGTSAACPDPRRPLLADVLDPALHDRLVNAWSMRNWNPARPASGHDQFFATFDRFSAATAGRTAHLLEEVANRAADGNLRYLELMESPRIGSFLGLGAAVGWHDDFGEMRRALLAAGLRDSVVAASRQQTAALAEARRLMRCGAAAEEPGCGVTVRHLFQVLRAFSPEQVFTQILAGFEMASSDPLVVGLNLVQPEDHPVAMADYALHMRVIQFLREHYPGVNVTLHAGELVPGLVPPEGLRFHISDAVRVAGASRIGHGIDIAYEDEPLELLREMAEREVMVEINLTSNDVILGVTGREHPLHLYLQHGVPVALSTDDEGVSRIDMTHEYVRAVREQGLGYAELKAMTRNSLEYAFVEGESLWSELDTLTPVEPCTDAAGGLGGASCREFIEGSAKARLQLTLERDLARFEARWAD